MTDIPTQPNPEEVPQLPEGGISDYMDQLVNEVTASDRPELRQAEIIADQLVGASLRVVPAHLRERNAEMLQEVDQYLGKSNEWATRFTRTEGLRRVAFGFDKFPVGKLALGQIGHRLAHNQSGEVVMTSLDQLAGYIFPRTQQEEDVRSIKSASNWKQVIIDEFTNYVTIAGRKEAWLAKENLGSDVQSVRQNQKTWEGAVQIAQQAGIDLDLLTKSAEFIKSQLERQAEALGESAVSTEVEPPVQIGPSYEHLFEQ